ncbi:Asp-tRNAAsn/Glu-tRNAGln amidotransferase A subunit and related amidase [Cladochytrium replicatum]|nr:Asp-tRNAAsn/Glu-tRNAGln amidotransferase A subunit and related amidase [Cladochytrium replicatum]
MADEDRYVLHNSDSPAATGYLLVVLTHLLERIGWLVAPTILNVRLRNQSNFYVLRSRVHTLPPKTDPLVPPPIHSAKANHYDPASLIESLVKSKLSARETKVFHSALDYHRAYLNGKITPSEVAEKLIAAIEDGMKPGGIRAVIKLDKDSFRAQAKGKKLVAFITMDSLTTNLLTESTERYRSSRPLSVFDGLPILVKDELDALPYVTSAGTSIDFPPALRDATVVARLRALGAIGFAKANMHEIGIDVKTNNPYWGVSRNPYNKNNYCGGSSGGSAAAVAAGWSTIAFGADGGGSVRIPAAHCGVFGLKATAGRIPATGAFPVCWSVGVVGPIAATAVDLALAYAGMAGPDPEDANTLIQPPVSISSFNNIKDLSDVRIGVYWPYFNDASKPIVAACKAALDELINRGATLVPITLPNLEPLRVAHLITIITEMRAAAQPLGLSKLSYPTRANLISTAAGLQAYDYVLAQRERAEGTKMLQKVFETVDAIVTPTTGRTPIEITKSAEWAGVMDYTSSGVEMRFAFLANLLGIPGVAIPVGYEEGTNLPVSMQIMGSWWSEDLLLRLAHATEDFVVGRRKPSEFVDLL